MLGRLVCLVCSSASLSLGRLRLIPCAWVSRNEDEIAISEVREKVGDAISTVELAAGKHASLNLECSPSDVETLLLSALASLNGKIESDEATAWVAQVHARCMQGAGPRHL